MSATIFSHFDGADKDVLGTAFSSVDVAAGEFLCKYGEPSKEMYIIMSGQIEVVRPRRKPGEFDIVGTLDAGKISGEAALTGVFPRSASLRAKDAVKVLVVTKDRIARFKKDHPQQFMRLYEGIFEQIGERFKALLDQIITEMF